jgi:phosphoglycolate phosphatase-like HAD superfamily hydrolase
MHTLLLWDIDGTLILSDGAGERALLAALCDEFGITGTLAGIELGGRTDPWIARQILRAHGLPASPAAIRRYLDAYLAALPAELARARARVLPGIRELLPRVAALPGIAQALLTGNLRRGAEIKLSHHGLWEHFPFGAFSDDSETRNDLGPHALRRALAHHAVEFAPARVFVIGDTPHDIACGKIFGAQTIALATGGWSVDELRAHQPTAVFADLSDPAPFLRLIGALG